MIFPEWQGREIVIFSRRVYRELEELGMDLWTVKYILEYGFDCPRSKRRKGIIEKCIRKGDKIIKVVVQEELSDVLGEIWVLRHVGLTSSPRSLLDLAGG